MKLYHSTTHNLPLGVEIVASKPTEYYQVVVDVLEKKRPGGKPSRKVCLFAADNIVAATTFLLGQSIKLENIRIYSVEMPSFHRAPFKLVHEIYNRIKNGSQYSALLSEYWNPQCNWMFWEYFGPSFTPINEFAAAALNEITRYLIMMPTR